jgi:hypothetical protein
MNFNEKYKNYLEKGHYGLDINNLQVVKYLDEEFQELIKIPDFKYAQIKLKFGMGRFYCTNNVPFEKIREIENKITELCQ